MRRGHVIALRVSAAVLPVLGLLLILHLLGPSLRQGYRTGTLPPGYERIGDYGAYVVYARPGNGAGAAAAAILARFTEAVVHRYGEAFDLVEPRSPFEVIVFSNRHDLTAWTRERLGSDFERNGGFYLPAWRAMGVVGEGAPGEIARALFHEGTHMILDTWVKGSGHHWSRWLNEGLATFFEASEMDPERIRIGGFSPEWVPVLFQAIRTGRWIPLDRLFEAGEREFEGEQNHLFYLESALLVAYLLDGAGATMRRRFLRYFESERAPGPVDPSAFRRIVGDPARIDADLRRYVENL